MHVKKIHCLYMIRFFWHFRVHLNTFQNTFMKITSLVILQNKYKLGTSLMKKNSIFIVRAMSS